MAAPNTKRLVIGITLCGGLVVAVVIWAYPVFRSAQRTALHSKEAAMAKALVDLQRTQVVGADLTTSWHVPAGAEYGSIMTSISKSSSGDNARRDARSKWIVDPWGKPFLIAMRKSEAGEFEYIVWSRGADGVSGTSDDVIFPRGRELPQGLVLPE